MLALGPSRPMLGRYPHMHPTSHLTPLTSHLSPLTSHPHPGLSPFTHPSPSALTLHPRPNSYPTHGRLAKVHTVHYSVGRAGQFKLHVNLRHQKTPLPGSPFNLTVSPGAGYPLSTQLPRTSISGTSHEEWQHLFILQATLLETLTFTLTSHPHLSPSPLTLTPHLSPSPLTLTPRFASRTKNPHPSKQNLELLFKKNLPAAARTV